MTIINNIIKKLGAPFLIVIVTAVVGLLIVIVFVEPVFIKSDLTDKELFLVFYVDLMKQTKAIDDKFEPFAKALKKGNVIIATKIAIDIQDDIRYKWSNMSGIKVPNLLTHRDAQKDINDAKDMISSAYFAKYETIEHLIEFSKQPSIYSAAVLKKDSEKYEARTLLGTINLLTAANKLGIKDSELKEIIYLK